MLRLPQACFTTSAFASSAETRTGGLTHGLQRTRCLPGEGRSEMMQNGLLQTLGFDFIICSELSQSSKFTARRFSDSPSAGQIAPRIQSVSPGMPGRGPKSVGDRALPTTAVYPPTRQPDSLFGDGHDSRASRIRCRLNTTYCICTLNAARPPRH